MPTQPVKTAGAARDLYRLWSGWCSRSFSVPWKDFKYRCTSRISSTEIGSGSRTESRDARAAAAGSVVVSIDSTSSTAPPAIASTTVHVEDLIHADRLGLRLDRTRPHGSHRFDLLDRAACDREHDDERHLALGAGDLKVEPFILMTEDLDVAALQAAPADRAVVEASPVADELDDAHRRPILRRKTRHHRCPSMHVHPSGPTTAECTVPAARTMRSPAFKSSSFPSLSSTNVIDPSTQYRTFSYEWLCGA